MPRLTAARRLSIMAASLAYAEDQAASGIESVPLTEVATIIGESVDDVVGFASEPHPTSTKAKTKNARAAATLRRCGIRDAPSGESGLHRTAQSHGRRS